MISGWIWWAPLKQFVGKRVFGPSLGKRAFKKKKKVPSLSVNVA